jgi:surface polysaccharide O-acyltransferase-like enzyme
MLVIATDEMEPPRQILRSIGAVLLGLVVIFVLSLATDQILHWFKVYPPWGEPMNETSDNILALTYRVAYAILGCYLTARIAPRKPMWHAMLLGYIGFVLSSIGVVAAIMIGSLGPNWYPILLALTSIPCAWVGGQIYESRATKR